MTATTTTATTAATISRTEDSVWRGIGSLYLIQAAHLLLPLVAVPFLARSLGSDAWGRAAAAQGFAMLAGLVVEYGFNISAVRMVARQRHDPAGLARTYAAVAGAQILLLAAAVAAAWAVSFAVPYLDRDRDLFWSAMIWMMPQVISFQWYYQGVERMPLLAALTLVGRALGVAGVLALVRTPGDAALSLLVPGLAGLAATVAAGLWPCRQLRPAFPTVRDVKTVLAQGLGLCGYRCGVALQGAANSFLLAFFLTPAAVGAYAGADRLTRAAGGLLEPMLVTFFPRIAYLRSSRQTADRRDADSWDRRSRHWLLAAGLALAFALAAAAPWLVALALGPGYEASIPVLRVLAFTPLTGVLCQSAGLNGLAARGEDRTLNLVVMGAGILQTGGLLLLGAVAPDSLAVWIAAGMVVAQFLQWRWLVWASARAEAAV